MTTLPAPVLEALRDFDNGDCGLPMAVGHLQDELDNIGLMAEDAGTTGVLLSIPFRYLDITATQRFTGVLRVDRAAEEFGAEVVMTDGYTMLPCRGSWEYVIKYLAAIVRNVGDSIW